jgi:hypothetical protein
MSRASLRQRQNPPAYRREDLLEARPIEETIAGEARVVRRDERENTARRGSKGERKSREVTPPKASAEEVFVHARDPCTRIDVLDSSRHIQLSRDTRHRDGPLHPNNSSSCLTRSTSCVKFKQAIDRLSI